MAAKQAKKNSKGFLDDFKDKMTRMDLNSIFIFGAIILVLVVGLYAIFAPKTAEVIGGNPACGKIVIAADGASLRANVSPTLAGAKYFLVVDPLTKKIFEKVKNPYTAATNPGRELVYLIAGKGEEAVIVGDIDPQSYGILSQFGIKVFGGYAGKVKNVIGLYRQARVAPMSQPPQVTAGTPNIVPDVATAVSPEMGPAPVAFTPDVNAGFGSFMCPQCRWQTNYPGSGGMGPMCPRCRICMVGQNCPVAAGIQNGIGPQQNTATQVAFGFGEQAFICPTCNWRMKCQRQGNAYPNCPNCGSAMAQDMANQGFNWNPGDMFGVNGVAVQNNIGPMQCPPNSYQPVMAQQGGYGPGQGPGAMNPMACPQNFYSPVNNVQQAGAGYAPVNNTIGFQNNMNPMQCPANFYQPGAFPQRGGGYGYGPVNGVMGPMACPQNFYQPVANPQQMNFGPGQSMLQNNFNQPQVQPQPSFWQGRNSNGYFICPGCNWRMYAEMPLGEYPRCPNCKQIMARGGVMNQNTNAQYMPPQNMNMAAPQQVALPAPVTQAPPISSNAQMAHAYRGVCTNCHQIIDAPQTVQIQGAAQNGAVQNDPAQADPAAQVAATCVLR